MKKLFSIIVLLIFPIFIYSQCPGGPAIYLYSQTDVDNFGINYGMCKDVPYFLSISGNTITNLNGLANVETINAGLSLVNCPHLNDISGLNNLTSISGQFRLSRVGVNDLQSLSSLNSVGSLSIEFSLNSLAGLESLTGTLGSLRIVSSGITSLDGLENIIEVSNSIVIGSNTILTDISGISHLDLSALSSFNLSSNLQLEACEYDNICNLINNPGTTSISINNNAGNCENLTTLTNACNDSDGDGVENGIDNCPEIANSSQGDLDADNIGDVCDNCPSTSNADQADNDSDSFGNFCDNCPNDANPNQLDTDGDNIGDVCDNCPNIANMDQTDSDGNGIGDACELTLIPDPNFEQALIDLGIDSDGMVNGQMLTTDAIGVTYLDISNKSINDLTGIEAFSSLATLFCYENQITNLDVSHNSNLTQLICYNNLLTSLEITNNGDLELLRCSNNQLTNIDVSNNPQLISLWINDNSLTNINVSTNTLLEVLYCRDNNLTSIDLTNNPLLRAFTCSNNLVTALDVTLNTALESLYCENNQITQLDLSTLVNLINFNGSTNLFSILDVRNGNNTSISTFNASSNPNLFCIYVDDPVYSTSNWTNIDPQATFTDDPTDTDGDGICDAGDNCPNLFGQVGESCDDGDPCTIDEIITADCNCAGTPIMCDDGDPCTMDSCDPATGCISTPIPDSDGDGYCDAIDNCPNVANPDQADTNGNGIGDVCEPDITLIPDTNFEQALIDLSIDSDGIINGQILTEDALGVTFLNVSNKNIIDLTGIEAFVDLEHLNCKNNQITELNVSFNTNLRFLYCESNQLSEIDVSDNLNLEWFHFTNNQISTVDVTNNVKLISLVCEQNQISSLDLSQNNLLYQLNCSYNPLSTIDVSHNPNLIHFLCIGNQLSSLDVSNNTMLSSLRCQNNDIEILDLTNNTSLTYLVCHSNQLTSLDLRNNNNSSINTFQSYSNPNLFCIYVDDPIFSSSNWLDIDPQASFTDNPTDSDGDGICDDGDICPSIPAYEILYVDFNATGTETGKSWTNALTHPQTAFDLAETCEFVKEVRIAEGTYTPTTTTDRIVSFSIPSNLTVKGGYISGGTQSNVGVTIFSGNIGDPLDMSDNSYHVLVLPDGGNRNIFSITVADGYANGPGLHAYGGGIFCEGPSNNLIYKDNLTDLEIENNYALSGGGGIYIDGFTLGEAEVDLWYLFIENNTTEGIGGGILVNGNGNGVKINNYFNFIVNNTASSGGGIYYNAFGGLCEMVVDKSYFIENSAENGGAIFINGREGGTTQGVFNHNHFLVNSATNGASVYNDALNNNQFDLKIVNNTSYFNTSSGGSSIYNFYANPHLQNNLLWNTEIVTELANVVSTPTLLNNHIHGINTEDPWLNDPDNGYFDPLPCSPLINSGSSIGFNTTDFSGVPVPYPGGVEDIGAREYPGNPYGDNGTVIFVNPNSSGMNNGTSWEDAFTDINTVLADPPCGGRIDTIWITDGTFYPEGDENSSIQVWDGMVIIGNFIGIESSLMERDAIRVLYRSNPPITTLSGDIGIPGDSTDNSYHVFNIPPGYTITLKDVIIEQGNADGMGLEQEGAAIINKGSLILNNVLIRNNYGESQVYNYTQDATLIIDNSEVIQNNTGQAIKNLENAQLIFKNSNKVHKE